MNSTVLLRQFKSNMVSFLDELIETFPSEGHFVLARIFIKDKIPIDMVIKHFIIDVLPYKQSIQDRDETFFIEKGLPIFNQVGDGMVNHFKELWMSSAMTEENKDVIWEWLSLFLKLSEKWQELRKQES